MTAELGRATLDTLPLNVAVVDPDGDIVLANDAWAAFEGETTGAVGSNYFAGIDAEADDVAAEAAVGIRAVLDGERERYSLEYPCHSPDVRRWFVLLAAPLTVEGVRHVALAHYDITERKLAELEVERTAAALRDEREALDHLLDHVTGLLADVTDLLVRADDRERVEAGVADRVVAADPYTAATVYRPSVTGERLEPVASAGRASPDDDGLALDGDADDPAVVAYRGRDVVVADDGEAPSAAVPLATADRGYGVLVARAADSATLDDRERTTLGTMGRLVANAMSAIENRELLRSSTGAVELECTVGADVCAVAALSARAGESWSHRGSVPAEDGDGVSAFFSVTGADGEAVRAAADGLTGVAVADVVAGTEDGCLVEVAVPDPVSETVSRYGGALDALSAADGTARVTVTAPNRETARRVFEGVAEAYGEPSLVGYHRRDRPPRTREGFRAALEEALTDRQATALRRAYLSGYFESPRRVTGDDLAESMGISRPTFHQHLRAAERKLLDAALEANW